MVQNSWVQGADSSGFSLANLPYGVAEKASNDCRVCVAIGDYALDLAGCAEQGLLGGLDIPMSVWSQPTLNSFFGLGPATHRARTSVWS